MMEETDRPFNLDRLLKYSKTIYPYDRENERCLLPYEILEIMEDKINNIDVDNKTLITTSMINGLKDFFQKLAEKLCRFIIKETYVIVK